MTPILVTIPDACRALGISRSTLYELIGSGVLVTRKIGRRTLLSVAELEAFAAGTTPRRSGAS